MSYSELSEWPGAARAVQVWQCPCGAVGVTQDGGISCLFCGRAFNARGFRIVTAEEAESVDAGTYGPDDDLAWGAVVSSTETRDVNTGRTRRPSTDQRGPGPMDTTAAMPTSEQLNAFRGTLLTAFHARGAVVEPGWPTRGNALDAIECAREDRDQPLDIARAMTVIDPHWTMMSDPDQQWLRGVVTDTLDGL